MNCCKNLGSADRALRGVIGLGAIGLGVFVLGVGDGAAAGVAATVVGAVLLGTALVGACPLYMPFKLSTCRPAAK